MPNAGYRIQSIARIDGRSRALGPAPHDRRSVGTVRGSTPNMPSDPPAGEHRAADITDEMLTRAEALIGVWLRRDVHWPAMAEDLAPIDIRRWAYYSVGDDNPLWSDEEYARGTRWGPVIAPPLGALVPFFGGRRNTYPPLKLAFAERERHPANVYVSPSTGIPVHPAAGHMDEEIAHEIGMPGPYDQGWMRANWMGHLVTNWCGDDAWVSALNVTLRKPNLVGDITWVRG